MKIYVSPHALSVMKQKEISRTELEKLQEYLNNIDEFSDINQYLSPVKSRKNYYVMKNDHLRYLFLADKANKALLLLSVIKIDEDEISRTLEG